MRRLSLLNVYWIRPCEGPIAVRWLYFRKSAMRTLGAMQSCKRQKRGGGAKTKGIMSASRYSAKEEVEKIGKGRMGLWNPRHGESSQPMAREQGSHGRNTRPIGSDIYRYRVTGKESSIFASGEAKQHGEIFGKIETQIRELGCSHHRRSHPHERDATQIVFHPPK